MLDKNTDNHNIPKDYDKTTKDVHKTQKPDNTAMVGGVKNTFSHSQKHSSSIARAMFLIILVALIVMLIGWLYLQFTNTKLVQFKEVCGNQIVDAYNDSAEVRTRGEPGALSNDIDGLKKLATDIKNLSGYDKDPTCQNIILEVAILNDDYQQANDSFAKLKKLHDDKKYTNNNLNTGAALYDYKIQIYSLPSAVDDNQDQGPKGGA